MSEKSFLDFKNYPVLGGNVLYEKKGIQRIFVIKVDI
jgi:hypothetical protein